MPNPAEADFCYPIIDQTPKILPYDPIFLETTASAGSPALSSQNKSFVSCRLPFLEGEGGGGGGGGVEV